jgi:acyl-homoserine lactone acylase PvdQ
MRRTAPAAALAVLVLTATAAAAGAPFTGSVTAGYDPSPTYRANDYADGLVRSILPPGENGLVNPTEALSYEATGARPSDENNQLAPYANLLYAPAALTDADLSRYYEDESFGVRPTDISRVEHPSTSVPVVIYRDRNDVPHIYGASPAAAAFGVGWAQAEDRLFFMDVLRHYGQGTLSAFLGPSCGFEQMDHNQLLVAPYTQAQANAQVAALPREYGHLGTVLRDMVDSYVQGVNAYIAAARTNPGMLPSEYAAALQPPQPWQPGDVVYVAALIGGILGKGGGGEVANAALLQYLTRHDGAAAARHIFSDMKEQNDPGAPTTIDRPFPYMVPGRVDPRTIAMPDNAAAPLTGGPTDTTSGCDLTAANPVALSVVHALQALPHAMSNALVVDAAHSADGHPIAVFGPQVAYFSPEILMEEDVHAPGYQAEGASFPGTGLVELGRGEDFAWSATSEGGDIEDQRLELICNPAGGQPQPQGTYYLFDGRCRPMVHEVFREVAVPKPEGVGAPTVITHDIYLTVHGVVQGWTTALGGRPVAIVNQRSTFGHEIDSGVGFVRWADPALTYNAASWMKGAADIQYTFNWFYVDDRDIAYFASGRLPIRPRDVDPNLPTWGTGSTEWRGWLPAADHPQAIDPAQGFLVSWNNKPAPGFSAADDTFSYGLVYRSQTLVQEIRHQFALHHGRITRAALVAAMESAATVDLDGRQVLRELLPYLSGHVSSPGIRAMLGQLRSWYLAGAHRRKTHPGDSQYAHAAAVAIMDELQPNLIRAFFDPIFAAGGIGSYDGADDAYRIVPMEWVNTPNNDGARLGSAYDDPGWDGYEVKLLRMLQRQPVAEPFSVATTRRVCGAGGMADCLRAVLAALTRTYRTLTRINGTADVAAWTQDTATHTAGQTMPAFDAIGFETVGLVSQPQIAWQNRPTFQQVVEFRRHRPR